MKKSITITLLVLNVLIAAYALMLVIFVAPMLLNGWLIPDRLNSSFVHEGYATVATIVILWGLSLIEWLSVVSGLYWLTRQLSCTLIAERADSAKIIYRTELVIGGLLIIAAGIVSAFH